MSEQFTNCTLNDIQLISGYSTSSINTDGNFKINVFSKKCSDYTKLSDEEKIALFEDSNGYEASIDDLKNLGKLKILMYTKQKPQ